MHACLRIAFQIPSHVLRVVWVVRRASGSTLDLLNTIPDTARFGKHSSVYCGASAASLFLFIFFLSTHVINVGMGLIKLWTRSTTLKQIVKFDFLHCSYEIKHM